MNKRIFSKKEKRRITLFIFVFFSFTTFMIVNIFPDWLKISNNKKENLLLEKKYEEMLEKEETLKAEVQKLKNPEYVERYAKEKYLYTAPNEYIIRKTND